MGQDLRSFSFIPLGVGDAFSARYYSSCLALQAEGYWILIDCPHPIRKILKEQAPRTDGTFLDIDDIHTVLLTHLHADHVSGLEGFGFYSYFVLSKRARLASHPDVLARLWKNSLSAGMDQLDENGVNNKGRDLEFYFHVTPLSTAHSVEIGPFSIECRKTIHHLPTTAFRISAAGRSLGYSSDTAFDPSLIEWLAEADLLIHECNLGVHTPYEQLEALDESIRSRMRLIHYPDNFDLDASKIEPLIPGRRYQV